MRILSWSFVALAACGAPSRNNGDDQPTVDAPVKVYEDAPAQQMDNSRVYAHSGTTLYRIDTVTLNPVMIGDMSAGLGAQSLTDLAVDKNDKMVGITLDKLYGIDTTSGAVTLIKDLSASAQNLTSLSYIPTDLDDPNSADILVSANSFGDVFQIDPATGNATKLGNYGKNANSEQIKSSGDLVGIRGLGIFATVNIGDNTTTDYLAQIDPATWVATPIGGQAGIGYAKIFGLGYWAGKFYGFVDGGAGAGKIVSIDQHTGTGSLLGSGTIRWYGAGVTTDAPILE
ncbi:MAG: hypothetical protein QM831_13955 [Kofleriaceae bacterium]